MLQSAGQNGFQTFEIADANCHSMAFIMNQLQGHCRPEGCLAFGLDTEEAGQHEN